MIDMLKTVTPKSDQLNADDLIGGQTLTVKINKVTITGGDQPVSIHFDGDNGKPYKPGKSMRRVLVSAWGSDANKYIGRSMTLYCDPTVTFGGSKVGGIRISHMSDIDSEFTMALTAAKAIRKPYTVKPLLIETDEGEGKLPDELFNQCRSEILAATTLAELKTAWEKAEKAAKDHRDSNALRGFVVLKDNMKKTIEQTAQENA